jgi:hypothetical protein
MENLRISKEIEGRVKKRGFLSSEPTGFHAKAQRHCRAGILACRSTGHSCPVFRTGDWIVARTRRQEYLRYVTVIAIRHNRCTTAKQNVLTGVNRDMLQPKNGPEKRR